MNQSIQTSLRNTSFEPGQKYNHLTKLKINGQNNLLTKVCRDVYSELIKRKRKKLTTPKKIFAEFYPYTNIKITLRQRGDKLLIRVSDILVDAPKEVMEGLAHIIISQQLKIKCEDRFRSVYRDYIYSDRIRSRKKSIRKDRSKKKITGHQGANFNLKDIFIVVNRKYLGNEISTPGLTWSSNSSKVRLGHFDPDLNIVVVSKNLDNKATPSCIIEYIIYHELLHGRCPGRYLNGRWYVHTPEFKREEKKFEELKFVKKWIKNRNSIRYK
jgi:hypothetical protein